MVVKSGGLFAITILILLALNAGCISEAAPLQPNITINVTPIATPLIITNVSQPLVKNELISYTETHEEWMYRNNGRSLGQPFQIERDNVSGSKSLKVNVKVYRSKFLSNFYESGADSWGTHYWWPHIPMNSDYKFLFVFVRMEMEGSTPDHDPGMWGFDSKHFVVQYQGQIIGEDTDHLKCIAIREMEYVYPLNKAVKVSDYGMTRINNVKSPANGATCGETGYLRMGESNAWDGYIIYQVPKEATESDLVVSGDFGGFGSAWWEL
jgi:hypothetical protein